jgi:ribosomal protein L7/L12
MRKHITLNVKEARDCLANFFTQSDGCPVTVEIEGADLPVICLRVFRTLPPDVRKNKVYLTKITRDVLGLSLAESRDFVEKHYAEIDA